MEKFLAVLKRVNLKILEIKKTVLIVILSIVILLLSATLYLFIETAPKDIEDEEVGSMYNIGEISFNLNR